MRISNSYYKYLYYENFNKRQNARLECIISVIHILYVKKFAGSGRK